jgi:hypothetical protein
MTKGRGGNYTPTSSEVLNATEISGFGETPFNPYATPYTGIRPNMTLHSEDRATKPSGNHIGSERSFHSHTTCYENGLENIQDGDILLQTLAAILSQSVSYSDVTQNNRPKEGTFLPEKYIQD